MENGKVIASKLPGTFHTSKRNKRSEARRPLLALSVVSIQCDNSVAFGAKPT